MRVVVVGGGIAGLAAAHRIVERAPQVEVIVLEQGAVVGGKLQTGSLAGRVVERGAETFLMADSALATSTPRNVPGGVPGQDDGTRDGGAGGRRADRDDVNGGSAQSGSAQSGSVDGGSVDGGSVESSSVESGGEGGSGEGGKADGFAGDSAAVELARAVGLGAQVVHPTPARAALAVDGGLVPMPGGTLMGIPVVDESGLDVPAGEPLLMAGDDLTVGGLVRARRGDRVVDRLVEPLLGGVYAGRADHLSARMALPGLARALESAYTLTDGVRGALAARAGRPGAPVFGTVAGGLGLLVSAVAARLPDVRLSSVVRGIARTATGWRLVVGSARDATALECDGLILAVPAAPAARLLSSVDGVRAVALDYASVALVGLALPTGALPTRALRSPADRGCAAGGRAAG